MTPAKGGAAKYLVGCLVVVLLLSGLLVAGIRYVTHRVKQKAAELEAGARPSQSPTKRSASSSAHPSDASSRGGSVDPSEVTSLLKDLGNMGNPANGSNQPAQATSVPRTPEEQSKALADAARVSQVIARHIDKPLSAIPPNEFPVGTGPISMPTPDSYSWTNDGAKFTWGGENVRAHYVNGGTVYGSCPVVKRIVPLPVSPPVKATGNQQQDWAIQYERTEDAPDADLVVRTGDINNLGFGWPADFDPFSGKSTPPHRYPWKAPTTAAAGTDRIELGSSYHAGDRGVDGYSSVSRCSCPQGWTDCQSRLEAAPAAITLQVGELPSNINAVLLQIFVDDFQAARYNSNFQVSLNGTRIPSIESAINSLDQTGPIGKLISLPLLPEYWPILKTGRVNLLIDDPTTHLGDGYAVDFVRILVNPHNFKYQVSLTAHVFDADRHTPIPGATVSAALQSLTTDKEGQAQLNGLPAGLVVATAVAPDYDESSAPADLVSGQNGSVTIQLHRHREDTAALEKEIAKAGIATVYGIHFDTDSAKLSGDSISALDAVLGLINNHPGSRWAILGHTDNQGNNAHNQALSENRSASVIAWLKEHGVEATRMEPQGFGASRPVADNATPNGRALNRRVEVVTLP